MRFIPDVLTGSRFFLATLMSAAIVSHSWTLATLFLLTAILTDAIDGEVARLLHLETDYGADFDQFADTFLWALLFISLALADKLFWLGLMLLLTGAFVFSATTLISRKSRWWFIRRHMRWIHPAAYALTLVAGLVWLTYLMVDQAGDGAPVFIMACCLYAGAAVMIVSDKAERIAELVKDS